MGQPLAGTEVEVGEICLEGGVLRGAGIDPEADLAASLFEVGDPHLLEVDAILGTLDLEVVFPPREAIPHLLDLRVEVGRCPVAIAAVSHDAAEVLELLVFVLDRPFDPVLAVEIENDAALVEAMMGLVEGSLDREGEELLQAGQRGDAAV